MTQRVVISGMGINTPLGDELDIFYSSLLQGKSAISNWKSLNTSNIYSKFGGDLSDYNIKDKINRMATKMPEEMRKRVSQILKKLPFATGLTVLCAVDAYLNSGLLDSNIDPCEIAVITGGHNILSNYDYQTFKQFEDDPEFIDPLYSMHYLDTEQTAAIGEVLGIKGPIYTVGGACASANVAVRSAIDEIRYHQCKAVLVVGPLCDYSPVMLQALALLGAISYADWHETPQLASRPFDKKRAGFVPGHGTGTIVLEEHDHAIQRGASIYAEVLGAETLSDACHLPTPSQEGQARTISRLLKLTGVSPTQIDYINMHATATPLGDITESNSIKQVFGSHAYKLKVNATKSMLGHCCWGTAAVEIIAGIMQMQGGYLHPSINVDEQDPEIDLDVCANKAVEHRVNYFLKNSFGFGGINAVSLFKRYGYND